MAWRALAKAYVEGTRERALTAASAFVAASNMDGQILVALTHPHQPSHRAHFFPQLALLEHAQLDELFDMPVFVVVASARVVHSAALLEGEVRGGRGGAALRQMTPTLGRRHFPESHDRIQPACDA